MSDDVKNSGLIVLILDNDHAPIQNTIDGNREKQNASPMNIFKWLRPLLIG